MMPLERSAFPGSASRGGLPALPMKVAAPAWAAAGRSAPQRRPTVQGLGGREDPRSWGRQYSEWGSEEVLSGDPSSQDPRSCGRQYIEQISEEMLSGEPSSQDPCFWGRQCSKWSSEGLLSNAPSSQDPRSWGRQHSNWSSEELLSSEFSSQDPRFCGRQYSKLSSTELPSSEPSSKAASGTPAPRAEGYTTVMVLNIPNHISLKAFAEKLCASRFSGTYNFCNIPRALSTGKNLGFAFVNFDEAEDAEEFAEEWAGVEIFGKGKRLKTKPAKVQGLQANVQLALKSMKRKNAAFKPLLTL